MELAQSTDKTFSLDELSALTEVPRRTIRYYIELGLLEGAEGETRAARYTRQHLETLLKIRRFAAQGIGLSHVKQRLAGDSASEAGEVVPSSGPAVGSAIPAPVIEVRSHLTLAPGVELVIEPVAARLSTEQLRRFMRAALEALARARKEKSE